MLGEEKAEDLKRTIIFPPPHIERSWEGRTRALPGQ